MDPTVSTQRNPSNPIRQGGDALAVWLTETFSSWLAIDNVLAFGYVAIPQLGEKAGDALRRSHIFADPTRILDADQQDIKDLLLRRLTLQASKPLLGQIESFAEKTHTSTYGVVQTPIQYGFDTPIGYLVVIVSSPEHAQSVINATIHVCSYVSASIRGERAFVCLEDFSRSSSGSDDSGSLAVLVDQTKNVLGCKAIILWLLQEDKDGAVLKKKYSEPQLQELTMFIGGGVAGRCAQTRTTLRFDDLQDTVEVKNKANVDIRHKNVVKANDWHSAIFMPIVYGDQVFGVIGVYSSRVAGFNDVDEKLLAPYVDKLARAVGSNRINGYLIANEQTKKIIPAINHTMKILTRIHDARNEVARAASELSLLNIDETILSNLDYYRERKRFADEAIKVAKELLTKQLDTVKALPSQNLNIRNREFSAFAKAIAADHEQTFRDAHKIEISTRYFRDQVFADFDDVITREVIVNVLMNAKAFLLTQKRDRRIDLAIRKESNCVVLEIEDNGPGIDPKSREKVFDMFYTTRPEGYGMGLTVARMYMTLQGGSITCERAKNHESGALLILRLPSD